MFLLNLFVAHSALSFVSVPTGIWTELRFEFPKAAHYAASRVSQGRKSLAIMPELLVPSRRAVRVDLRVVL